MPAACSLSSAVARSGTCSMACSSALLVVPGAARPLTACSGLSCTCAHNHARHSVLCLALAAPSWKEPRTS